MTVMSRVNAQSFAEDLELVLPKGEILDPVDFVDVFNLRRESPLGKDTFKKYLSLVYKTGYLPNLKRKRDSSGKFIYFVEKSSGPIAGSSSVSDKALLSFVGKVKDVMRVRCWYSVPTLRKYYNIKSSRALKIRTFRYYMGLAFRRGLWDGLERKKERGVYKYRWEESSNVSTTPIPQEIVPSASLEQSCDSCGGTSPSGAKFCMHCGASLRRVVRVAVQEDFFPMTIPFEDVTEEEVVQAIKAAMLQWVDTCDIRQCSMEDGTVTYTVSGEKSGKN